MPVSKQLGIKFDKELWIRIRVQALKENETGTTILEKAARRYLVKHENVSYHQKNTYKRRKS